MTVDLPGETALGAKPKSFVLHPFCLDLGMLGVGHDLERQEVAQIEASGLLKSGEDISARTHQAKVDVLRRSCAVDPELEGHAALERGGVTENGHDPREKPIEDEELPGARDDEPLRRALADAVLQGFLERRWAVVGPHGHAASPPNPRSAVLTSLSSAFVTSPRLTASRAAWRSRSGASFS